MSPAFLVNYITERGQIMEKIDFYNLFGNRHVWIKMYREFYHCIIFMANEGRHVRISDILYIILTKEVVITVFILYSLNVYTYLFSFLFI